MQYTEGGCKHEGSIFNEGALEGKQESLGTKLRTTTEHTQQ